MKKALVFVIVGFLISGCSSGEYQEINTLQTQVADLSANADDSSNTVPVLADAADFVAELGAALTDKGWGVEYISESTFYLTTPNDNIFIIEYIYESSTLSRVMIYSIWKGVGTSNLEYAVLSEVNNANDQQYLAKISVDSDGDFWMETTIPFTDQLDVDFFCDYVEWFEENQTYVLLNYFTDYIQ